MYVRLCRMSANAAQAALPSIRALSPSFATMTCGSFLARARALGVLVFTARSAASSARHPFVYCISWNHRGKNVPDTLPDRWRPLHDTIKQLELEQSDRNVTTQKWVAVNALLRHSQLIGIDAGSVQPHAKIESDTSTPASLAALSDNELRKQRPHFLSMLADAVAECQVQMRGSQAVSWVENPAALAQQQLDRTCVRASRALCCVLCALSDPSPSTLHVSITVTSPFALHPSPFTHATSHIQSCACHAFHGPFLDCA
jgi:hypothetical protein